MDNKTVFMPSTAHGIQNSQIEQKQIQVPKPAAVAEYNINMIGVYMSDRMLSFSRMSIQFKKWTVCTLLCFRGAQLELSRATMQLLDASLLPCRITGSNTKIYL
ncbi:hypothetical protein ILYODFUR_025651 [Ilyodon furcidens]|uniref:Uncharacterized protein n=1 Tax=Ilyodon furcidens TaxID=33524 RepID=A0ABV0TXN2_9TELE